jgi:hypothetical protein
MIYLAVFLTGLCFLLLLFLLVVINDALVKVEKRQKEQDTRISEIELKYERERIKKSDHKNG